MRSLIFIIGCALISGGKAYANDINCLSKIIHAEARGESFPQIIKLGQAAVTKAEDDDTNVCQLRGVKRKAVPKELKPYYAAIANELLTHPSTSLSGGANRWHSKHNDNIFRISKKR